MSPLAPAWSAALFTGDPDDGGVEIAGTRVELDAAVRNRGLGVALVNDAEAVLRVPDDHDDGVRWIVIFEQTTPTFSFRTTATAWPGDDVTVPVGTLMEAR